MYIEIKPGISNTHSTQPFAKNASKSTKLIHVARNDHEGGDFALYVFGGRGQTFGMTMSREDAQKIHNALSQLLADSPA